MSNTYKAHSIEKKISRHARKRTMKDYPSKATHLQHRQRNIPRKHAAVLNDCRVAEPLSSDQRSLKLFQRCKYTHMTIVRWNINTHKNNTNRSTKATKVSHQIMHKDITIPSARVSTIICVNRSLPAPSARTAMSACTYSISTRAPMSVVFCTLYTNELLMNEYEDRETVRERERARWRKRETE